MSFKGQHLFISFKHISHKKPEQLERLMLKIQIDNKVAVQFTPPTFSNGLWHSWYNHDFSKDIRGIDRIASD